MNFSSLRKLSLFLFFFLFLFSCTAQTTNKKIDIFLCKAVEQADKKANNEVDNEENSKTEKEVKKENLKKITVELAISPEEKQKGFMERELIPEATGMLFLYKKDRKMRFWMKNTPHPLSIAYIDSSGMIREIYDMKPYSLETVASTHSVRYALEVPQGMFKRMGIEVGDKITEESIFLIKRQFY